MKLNRREIARLALFAAPMMIAPQAATAGATSPVLREALVGTAAPAVSAVTIRDFRAESEQVAGMCAAGGREPVRRGMRWHPGSNGKAMTATLIARLVETGALAWDRPLAAMLPDIAVDMQPAYHDVTLTDLLSHRAGLPENGADAALFASFLADASSLPAQRARYVLACLREAPVGPVRAAASYSNTGFVIAAVCAERATGRAFEDLIRAEVFAPLGMRSVSFGQFGGRHEPQGHVDGRIADRAADANPAMFAPAGAMRMAMGDWARFCIDQMRGEHGRGRLLRAASYRFLHAPQAETSSALGWGAAAHPMNLRGPALTHSGSDGNWYALVCLFPQTGAGVIAAANAGESMGGDRAALAVMRALAKTVAPPQD